MFEQWKMTTTAPGLMLLPSGAVIDLSRLVFISSPPADKAAMSTDGGEVYAVYLTEEDSEAIRSAIRSLIDAQKKPVPA